MEPEEYELIQWQLLNLGAVVADMDLPGFLAAIRKAETLGPILDPSLYIQAGEQLDQVRRIAVKANELRQVVLQIREKELAGQRAGG